MTVWMSLSLVELFFLGVIVGSMIGQRENPNAPKPKNWEDKLLKQWTKGFRAGEKSMLSQMGRRIKDEELLQSYYSAHGKIL